jgi:uncharacterized protein (TIGR03083 family)
MRDARNVDDRALALGIPDQLLELVAPGVRALVRAELSAYLDAAGDPDAMGLPTRCSPWTVRDLTAHLAMTFKRFARMLEQSRAGDLSPPFAREELAAENLRAVAAFTGDPRAELRRWAEGLVAAATDPDEPMAHQFGPIPVGLQLLFGLDELVIHHDDLAAALGSAYRPPDPVVRALVPVWERALRGLPPGADDWARILAASGR